MCSKTYTAFNHRACREFNFIFVSFWNSIKHDDTTDTLGILYLTHCKLNNKHPCMKDHRVLMFVMSPFSLNGTQYRTYLLFI
jgi:hypothetical protein